MLNDSGKINTYKQLAEECGISHEINMSLQPPSPKSPTEEVMKDILGRNPYYTVDELFTDLREMGRTDVVEAISRHFEGVVTFYMKIETSIVNLLFKALKHNLEQTH